VSAQSLLTTLTVFKLLSLLIFLCLTIHLIQIYKIISHTLILFSDKINYNKIYDKFYFLIKLSVPSGWGILSTGLNKLPWPNSGQGTRSSANERLTPNLPRGRGKLIGGNLDVDDIDSEQNIKPLQSLDHCSIVYQYMWHELTLLRKLIPASTIENTSKIR
jgi:hypothetical protein